MPAHSKAAEQQDIAAAVKGCAFEPPDDLSERGAALWVEVMQTHPGSFWKRTHLPFLRQYIDAVMACDQLDAEIKEQGYVCRGEKGGLYMNPLVNVRDRERAQMKQLARMLGLSPDTTLDSAADKLASQRAKQRAAAVADAMNDSQGLIPGLERIS
jgi:P27 family predicted phage terminase small subunit